MSYIEDLADFAAGLTFEALPEVVQTRARLVLLDTLGAIAAGLREPEFERLAPALSQHGNGSALTALRLGAAGVAVELDEGCAASRGHPGIHVVPAILAGQQPHHELGDLLAALVAGYEVAARLGRATTFRPGLHPHGTWGVCGAAVATAKLRGFDAGQMAEAIRIAASLPIATHYEAVHQGTSVRNLWSGLANFNGVLAADLVTAGFTGPADMPARVLGETLGTAFDRVGVSEGLGRDFLILGNSFKLDACCRRAHASVDALRAAIAQSDVRPAEIDAIEVETYARAVEATGRPGVPSSSLAAKFSIPYILSAYLQDGRLDHAAFGDPRLIDPSVAALIDKVTVAEDPALTALLPRTRAARVSIRSGHRLWSAEAHGSRGDPHDPLSRDEVVEKFVAQASPGFGDAEARRLAAAFVEGRESAISQVGALMGTFTREER